MTVTARLTDVKGRFVAAAVNDQFFARRSPQTLWLAGLIAADGHIDQNGKRWTLGQSGPEGLARLEHVVGLMEYGGRILSTQPARGRCAYSISVSSRRMVADLAAQYGIAPAKTLTYRWPNLSGDAAAAFLRGYIEGDGCVSIYPTPTGTPFLHLSYVGTPEFVDAAMAVTPAKGRCRQLVRCKNLAEVRYNGRNAWAIGAWLYERTDLYESAKVTAYREHVATARPKWIVDLRKRLEGLRLLADGVSTAEVAARLDVHPRVPYTWKAQLAQTTSSIGGQE